MLEAPFRLRLTPPRGLFDAYTVPLLPTFRRQAGTDTPGQLVAVVGPKGTVAAAGIRRGDVITAVNGRSVATSGGWSAAMRALAANTPAAVELVRRGSAMSVQVTPKPDWEKPPDYATSLSVAVRRAPADFAYSFAQARQLVEAGKLVDARELMDGWRASWRDSAAGQLVAGDLLAKQVRWKQALGAYSRARARDETLAAAELGRGIALSKLGKDRPSLVAFNAAGPPRPGRRRRRRVPVLRPAAGGPGPRGRDGRPDRGRAGPALRGRLPAPGHRPARRRRQGERRQGAAARAGAARGAGPGAAPDPRPPRARRPVT